jgi:hypothetical protein
MCFQILFRSCMRVKFTISLRKRGTMKMLRSTLTIGATVEKLCEILERLIKCNKKVTEKVY